MGGGWLLGYLRPLTLVATRKPLATRSLAMPTPMSPIEMTPTLEGVSPFAAMFGIIIGLHD